jgi:HTH-type transcriptional regulator/antitoxin HigA
MVDSTDNVVYKPGLAIAPGEFLKDSIDELGMSQSELAQRLGRPQKTVNEIINGKAAITTETALQLEKVLNTPAHYWTNLQSQYQEVLSRQEELEVLSEMQDDAAKYPYKQMAKFGWVDATSDKIEQVRNLLYFFGTTNFKEIFEEKLLGGVSFRVSENKPCLSHSAAAWLRQGVIESRKGSLKPYSKKDLIAAIPEMRRLTLVAEPNEMIERLKALLAGCGVSLVVTRNLTNTPINGATRWVGRNPLVQMTIRNSWVDIFWFSFFHEIGHVLQTGKTDFKIDLEKNLGVRNEEEDKADNFAQETIIPDEKYYLRLKSFLSEESDYLKRKDTVIFFSKQIEIHPGCVVGRLQHDGVLERNQMNDLRIRYSWK